MSNLGESERWEKYCKKLQTKINELKNKTKENK